MIVGNEISDANRGTLGYIDLICDFSPFVLNISWVSDALLIFR